MSNKSVSIEKLEKGFVIRTSYDPNDYSSAGYQTGEAQYQPVENKAQYASSPENLGQIIADFYSN